MCLRSSSGVVESIICLITKSSFAFPEFYESALIGCLKIGIVRINSDWILSRVRSLTTANHRIADHNSTYGLKISHIKSCYLNCCYMHIEIQKHDFSHLVVQICDEFVVTNILFPNNLPST